QAAAEVGSVGLEVTLVLDRLFFDVFERDQPALPVVTLELGLRRGAIPDFDQARGQIDGVVDAAVHAHAAERIVDLRGQKPWSCKKRQFYRHFLRVHPPRSSAAWRSKIPWSFSGCCVTSAAVRSMSAAWPTKIPPPLSPHRTK